MSLNNSQHLISTRCEPIPPNANHYCYHTTKNANRHSTLVHNVMTSQNIKLRAFPMMRMETLCANMIGATSFTGSHANRSCRRYPFVCPVLRPNPTQASLTMVTFQPLFCKSSEYHHPFLLRCFFLATSWQPAQNSSIRLMHLLLDFTAHPAHAPSRPTAPSP